MKFSFFLLSLLLTFSCSIANTNTLPVFNEQKVIETTETPANLKVAFLGDSHDGINFDSVLKLIKKEKAEVTVHMGDLSYSILPQGPKKWNDLISKILGPKYPYLVTIGNHDKIHWHEASWGYITLFKERIKDIKDLKCQVQSQDSDFGVKSFCEYKGLLFLLSGVGTRGSNHEDFIEKVLSKHKQKSWKICAWHKNQRTMQVGNKPNEVGWQPYKICNKYGAIIATGHEHSYARTKTLTKMGDENQNHGASGLPELVELGDNKNFVFVNGVGGHSIRPYNKIFGALPEWWASIYTSDYTIKNRKTLQKGANINKDYGVLFVTFNYLGQKTKAKAQFITAKGKILDEFMIEKK